MLRYLQKNKNFTLLLILTSFYSVLVALRFLKSAYIPQYRLQHIDTNLKSETLIHLLIEYVTMILFMGLVVLLTKLMIDKMTRIVFSIIFHLLLSLSLGFFMHFGSIFLSVIFGQGRLTNLYDFNWTYTIIDSLESNFLIYFSIVLISYTYYFTQKNKQVESEKELISEQLSHTKLRLLKSNLQPHFLFNTLNSITALIDINKTHAQNTIADLANLLRELLNIGDKNLITLEQELDMLVKYINIIEVRFSDDFSFSPEIDDALLSAKFPSLLLQPIIENSIKHGYDYNTTNLEVDMSIEKENDCILISISNNGKLLASNFTLTEKNIGITNTIERLKTIYNNDFKYYMRNKKDGKGIITHISIPYIG